VRVVILSLALIGANALATWTMGPAMVIEDAAAASVHHCDGDSAKNAPSPTDHGKACPCCHHGCVCLHASSAAVPERLIVAADAPVVHLTPRERCSPPAPFGSEILRPPIA
jgi:hypothetical protein